MRSLARHGLPMRSTRLRMLSLTRQTLTTSGPSRPHYSRRTRKPKRSLLDEKGTICWRCGWPIYEGQLWERGHTLAAHHCKALGLAEEVRPEHKVCNRIDGHKQTKIAAKIKRMQKKGFNPSMEQREKRKAPIRSRGFDKPTGYKYDWKKGRMVKK